MCRQLMTVSCSQPIFDIRKEQAFVKIERETKEYLRAVRFGFREQPKGKHKNVLTQQKVLIMKMLPNLCKLLLLFWRVGKPALGFRPEIDNKGLVIFGLV